MIKRLSLILSLVVFPALAQTYAVPDNGNPTNDCVTGYVCIPATTQQTFSIGQMSFPPPWLQYATDAMRAQYGILTVVNTAAPTGNFGSVSNSIQMVNGVPTQVWTTTAAPSPTPQQQYNTALSAGLTISCAASATVCTSGLAGTYAVDQTAQNRIQAENLSFLVNSTFTNGQVTRTWLDISGNQHAFTIPQFKELSTAIGQYVDSLYQAMATAQSGGTATWPAATSTLQ